MAIDIDGITDERWARQLWKFSGRDGIVEYWINDAGRFGMLEMSGKEARFVRRTFRRLDSITGLRFKERRGPRSTDIDVHSAEQLGSGIVGSAVTNNGWFDVIWRDERGGRLTRNERSTIRHELGHVLGLDHPYGDGFNRRYDSSDTVMSYYDGGFANYTSSDVKALQALW